MRNSFNITMLMSEQCNLRCSYCYERFLLKSSSPKEFGRIKKFFKKISSCYKTINVSFFGGEPLLSLENVMQLANENASLQTHFKYSMTTNGTMLYKTVFRSLVEIGCTDFHVTLDGMLDSHDRVRKHSSGKGTFEKIYRNLRDIRESAFDCSIVIRVNASLDNSNDIPLIARQIATDFGGDKRFSAYIRPVGRWGGANDSQIDIIEEKKYKILEEKFYAMLPPHMRYRVETKICYAAMPNHLLIYPNGRVGKCTLALHDPVNDVGGISEDGSLMINALSYSYWSRGFLSGSRVQLACPYLAP